MREAAFRMAIADAAQPAPHVRFSVYRNNVDGALVNALKVRYPAVAQIAGQEFFALLSRLYSSNNLPASAVLIDYGETYPDFIETYSPAEDFPYLAGLARVESLWWRAYHAAEETPLEISRLAALTDFASLKLVFHGSAALFSSSYAAGSIWRALRSSGSLAGIDLAQPELLLIARPDAEVELRILPPETYNFLSYLMAGEPIAKAAELSAAGNFDFDLQTQLTALLAARIVTGFSA